jgi:diadenosine tetraphosphatase ApaH/serine/threonine PP2A family protein phosphatase
MPFLPAALCCTCAQGSSLDKQDVNDADVPAVAVVDDKDEHQKQRHISFNSTTSKELSSADNGSTTQARRASYRSGGSANSTGSSAVMAWSSEADPPEGSLSPAKFASFEGYDPFELDVAYGGSLVELDEMFDMHDPAVKTIKALQLSDIKDDVLHERLPGRWKTVRELFRPTKGNQMKKTKGSDDDSEHGSDSDMEHSPSHGSDSAPSKRRFSFCGETVTNWGILVGKVMRRRVHGMTAHAMKTVHSRRVKQSSASGGNLILPAVQERASLIVDQARSLSKWVAEETDDCFDHDWQELDTLIFLFGRDHVDTLMLLSNSVRKVLAAQPTLVEASVPCRVFGDIHGQLRDLLIFLRTYGFPRKGGPSFVFNGDFVDRGSHSLEVIGLLFALKILMPKKVFMVRGNHEDRIMNEKYGFQDECLTLLGSAFGKKTYELIHGAFCELPLACLIADKILVVHGGIGEGKFSLNDIRAVRRPVVDVMADSMVWNILWSDPIEDDHSSDQEGIFGVHVSPRCSSGLYKFGWNVTKTFCATNGLGMVIRSHQAKRGGVGFSVMHDKMCVRVFSARDYEGHGNDGSVILVKLKDESQPRGQLLVRPQVIGSLAKHIKKEENFQRKMSAIRKTQ